MSSGLELLNNAIVFAVNAHKGQYRKGSRTPYIMHCMEVSAICSTFTSDLEVMAAAVLHDVVEDAGVSMDEVRALFSERVATLVAGDTENKRSDLPATETWKIRKVESIEHMRAAADPGVRMVCLADKLSNMRSIHRDYEVLGDELWNRFHQHDPREHAWYYQSIADLLKDELGETDAWKEYAAHVRAVFGS